MKVSSSTSSSKTRRSQIRTGALYVLGVFVVFWVTGVVFHSAFGEVYESLDPAWTDTSDPIEAVILGSSQAQHGYNPLVFEELTGLHTYNLGSAGQKPDSTYYLFKDLLQEHRPEIVILDVYWRTLEGQLDFSQLERSFAAIQHETVRREFFREGFPLHAKITHLIPVLRYRQDLYWFFESQLNTLLGRGEPDTEEKSDPNDAREIDFRGHTHAGGTIPEQLITAENKFRNYRFNGFSPRQLRYLARIIELARNRDIPLVVMAAPVLPESRSFVDQYRKLSAELAEFFASHDTHYVDLNLPETDGPELDRTHFVDENHLNGRGADLVTEWIARGLLRDEVPVTGGQTPSITPPPHPGDTESR